MAVGSESLPRDISRPKRAHVHFLLPASILGSKDSSKQDATVNNETGSPDKMEGQGHQQLTNNMEANHSPTGNHIPPESTNTGSTMNTNSAEVKVTDALKDIDKAETGSLDSKDRHSSGTPSDGKGPNSSGSSAADVAKQKEREERLKLAREKASHDRKRKLTDLQEAQKKAQEFRKKQEEDRRKKLEEMKRKEEEHRAIVDERRRKLLEEDNTRKQEIIRRSMERDQKGMKPKRPASSGLSFGSTDPRSRSSVDLSSGRLSSATAAKSSNNKTRAPITSKRLSVSTSHLARQKAASARESAKNRASTSLLATSASDLIGEDGSLSPGPKSRSKSAHAETRRSRQDIQRTFERLSTPRTPQAQLKDSPTKPHTPPKMSPAPPKPMIPRNLPREGTSVKTVTVATNKNITPTKGPLRAIHIKLDSQDNNKPKSPGFKEGSPAKERAPSKERGSSSERTRPAERQKPTPKESKPTPRDIKPAPKDNKPTPKDVKPTLKDNKPIQKDTKPKETKVKEMKPAPKDTRPPVPKEKTLPKEKPAPKAATQKPAKAPVPAKDKPAPKAAQPPKEKAKTKPPTKETVPKEKPVPKPPKEPSPTTEIPPVAATASVAAAAPVAASPEVIPEEVLVVAKEAISVEQVPVSEATEQAPAEAAPKETTDQEVAPPPPASQSPTEEVAPPVAAPATISPTQPKEVAPPVSAPATISPTQPKEVTPPVAAPATISPTQPKKELTKEEEYKAKLAEKRRLAREKAEREAEEEKKRQEQLRLEEEERQRKEEEEEQRMMEEQMRLAAVARKAEEERLRKAIEAEEQRKKEEAERLEVEKIAREEAERRAVEEAEQREKESIEKAKKEEEERLERKKRLEMIMKRVKTDDNAPKAESPSSPSRSLVTTPAQETAPAVPVESEEPTEKSGESTPPAAEEGSSPGSSPEEAPPSALSLLDSKTQPAQFKSPLLQQMLGKNRSRAAEPEADIAMQLATKLDAADETVVTPEEKQEEVLPEKADEDQITEEKLEENLVSEETPEDIPAPQEAWVNEVPPPQETQPAEDNISSGDIQSELSTQQDGNMAEQARSIVEGVVSKAAETIQTVDTDQEIPEQTGDADLVDLSDSQSAQENMGTDSSHPDLLNNFNMDYSESQSVTTTRTVVTKGVETEVVDTNGLTEDSLVNGYSIKDVEMTDRNLVVEGETS